MNNQIIDLADAYLTPYRIKQKPDGQEIIPLLCPFCHGGSHNDRYTFALSVEKGCYVCKRGSCGAQGSVEELARFLGSTEKNLRGKSKMKMPKMQKYSLPNAEILPPTDAIFAYFEKRKISKATVEAFKIGADAKGMIVFPFYENGVNVFVKYRRPWKPTAEEAKKSKEWRDPNTKPVLFHMDDCVFSSPLIITEGQIDAMSLYEAGMQNVVSVPSGCDDLSWVESCFDWLEKFKQFVLFGDNDDPGRKMVREVAKRLDESRCLIVEDYPLRPDGKPCKDANEILYYGGAQALADAVASAEEIPLKGILDLADVQPVDETTIPRIKTMIPLLDESIGGLAPGSTTIFTGKAGDGKLLADDTPVFTRSGWKNHGDLVVGDEVVGLDGQFKKVTYVFPKDFADLCVTFSNGEKIRCHHNHEWVIDCGSEQKIMTAGEMYIARQTYRSFRIGEGDANFKLPIRTPMNAEDFVSAGEIISITQCTPERGNCISVEGGIYCVGRTMLPTHNSTLTGQLLLNAIEQGKSVCAYSGELRKEKFQTWINLQAAGSEWITLKYDTIRGKQVPIVPWAVQQRIIEWYRGKFFLFDNNEIFESNMAESIIEVFTMAVRRYGCELFLVDNMMTSLSDVQEETRAQGQFINALKKFAGRYNVHVLVVAHPRKTKQGEKLQKDDVGGNSQIVNLADTAIVVERPNLRLIKNRDGGRLRTIECCYCADSHRIYQADTGDFSKYSWDKTGLVPPDTHANSLPEYGIQIAEQAMPF